MSRRIARLLPALLALALPGLAAAAGDEFPVRPRTVEDRKVVFGTVESVDRTVARTRIGGTVEKLVVDEGSRVEAGEEIARVTDPKLPIELAALDARLKALEAERALDKLELDRVRRLRKSGTVSQARLDAAETKYNVVRAQIAAQKAERAVIVQRMAEGAVLAPKSGRVLSVAVTEGAVVLPGEPVATIAVERYILRIRLPERHARFIREGDRVLVGARGLGVEDPGTREGRIVKVYPQLEQGRVVADVAVEGLCDYFVGERARVYVGTGARTVFAVPEDYVFRRYGVSYVRLKTGREVVVQPGQPVAGGIEILSGLEPGDVLVRP